MRLKSRARDEHSSLLFRGVTGNGKKVCKCWRCQVFQKKLSIQNVFPLVLLSLNILCAIQILVCSYLSFCVLWCYHFCPGDIFSKNNIRCNKNFFSSFKVCQSKLECLPLQINVNLAECLWPKQEPTWVELFMVHQTINLVGPQPPAILANTKMFSGRNALAYLARASLTVVPCGAWHESMKGS